MESKRGQDGYKKEAGGRGWAIWEHDEPRTEREAQDSHLSETHSKSSTTKPQKTWRHKYNESLTDDRSRASATSAYRKRDRQKQRANWKEDRSYTCTKGAAHSSTQSQSVTNRVSGYRAEQENWRIKTDTDEVSVPPILNAHHTSNHRGHHHPMRARNSTQRKEKPPTHYFTRDDFEELNQADNETVSRCISQNENGFLDAFKHDRFLKSPKVLKQLITIVHKLTQSSDTQTALRISASLFGSSGEHALFMFHLEQLMKKMYSETKTFIRKENIHSLYHLTEIGKFCFEKIPKTVLNTFPIQPIRATVDNLVKYNTVDDNERVTLEDIEQNLLKLQIQHSCFEEEQVKSKPKKPFRQIGDDDHEPPEHYSTLSILPEPQEINHRAKKPYLRPNIIKGEYRDWQHYLDVQFRLLREDFVGPLREGINEHIHNPMLKGGDIRVYRIVKIQQPVCLDTGIGYKISFSNKTLLGINWEHTDRFKYGGFLCLSTDGFKTIIFATVADRKIEQLERGIVIIKFESSTTGFQLHSNAEYTMVESVAYLEAYRHVLEKLQAISEEHEIDLMPFQKYIVKCKFDEIPLPKCLNHSQHTIFDLNVINEIKSKSVSSEVDLTQPSSWPDADSTDLDPSQMKALQAALTQEISVIQGPPGTGKTYVGLKIVKSFLANRKVWDPKKITPILVVCYTNHALDQFLEGIRTDMIEGKPPNVTRIGTQSKSEMLKELTLREKLYKANENGGRGFKQAKDHMTFEKNRIEKILESIGLSAHKIIEIQYLEDVISPDHYQQLKKCARKPIENWLGLHNELSPNSQVKKISKKPQQVAKKTLLEPHEDVVESNYEMVMQMIAVAGQPIDYQYRPRQPGDVKFDNVENFETVQMRKNEKNLIIKKQLNSGLKPMTTDEATQFTNLWSLDKTQRWRLYLYWRDKYITQLRQTLETKSESYQASCEDYHQKKQVTEMPIIRDSDIVGMTTTGAAKHNYIIKAMRPKIVVVEEAAEIFEPHIFTSLSPTVQQLVLIGDHQQLRPKPTYYELEKKYDFNVSLFERLAKNNCPVQTLNIQHRMRPEIASLITPAIYKELHDHESVLNYGHVQGIGKNVFFVTHTEPEHAGADDRRSHSNPHEAKYLGALCDYLLKQGYKPEEITILTLYRGQLLEIKNTLRVKKIKGVRTAVVDDFQGEENRIILLSLVRSNNEQKIGFVGIENRVCVALSRAKMSLFIIGNVEMLRNKAQTIWPKIIEKLTEMGSIGEALPLHCHIHQDQKIDARVPQDFLKCPEGGCQKKCEARLPCGHVCPRMCHPYDIEHLKYKCLNICKKQLTCGHTCKNECHKCSDGCKPCKEKAIKVLPTCGHSEHCFCSDIPEDLNCSKICDKTLKCGHFCQKKCSQPCTTQCMVKVDKQLPCGHTVQDFCYLKEDEIKCTHPCSALLDCEHLCTGTCYTCNMGRFHKSCALKCSRILNCGHPCEFPCSLSCPPCIKPCENFCTHSHCPKKCFEPCAPCMEPCDWSCPHFTCTQPCGMPCNRPPCNQPCKKRLEKCGHLCIGLCGEICPKICRICDKKVINDEEEDARFILLPDCNHIVEVEMLDQWMSADDSDISVDIIMKSTLEDTERLSGTKTDIQTASQIIGLKACPLCNVPIRNCLRYGNDIKNKLKDFEIVKSVYMKTIRSIQVSSEFAKMQVAAKKVSSKSYNFIARELHSIKRMMEDDPISGRISFAKVFPHVVKANISFLHQIMLVHSSLDNDSADYIHTAYKPMVEKIIRNLKKLKVFVMQYFLSQQQLSDSECEMRRLTLLGKAINFQIKCTSKSICLNEGEEKYIAQTITGLEESGWKREKISKEKETVIFEELESLNDKYGLKCCFKVQTNKIVRLTGLSKGHWYKCPKGHYFAIEICKRPMLTEQDTCPECKAKINKETSNEDTLKAAPVPEKMAQST